MHVYQTLHFSETLRKIFMGLEGARSSGVLTPVFSARDAEENILRRGSHEHCFVLPFDQNVYYNPCTYCFYKPHF